jgi:hypothetical protein
MSRKDLIISNSVLKALDVDFFEMTNKEFLASIEKRFDDEFIDRIKDFVDNLAHSKEFINE